MTIMIISNDRQTPDAVTMITIVTASKSKEKQVAVEYTVAHY